MGWGGQGEKRKRGHANKKWVLAKENRSCGQKLLPLQFPGLSLPEQGKPGFLSKDSLIPHRISGKSAAAGGGGRNGILKTLQPPPKLLHK